MAVGAGEPKVGQVVTHHFLWVDEQAAGRMEGRKARPCIIIAVEPNPSGAPRVTVLPITSSPPRTDSIVLAVPETLKGRLGLDPARAAWVVIDDANVFVWPGYDLVPQPGGGFVRGLVTAGFFEQIRVAVLAAHSVGRPRGVNRDV